MTSIDQPIAYTDDVETIPPEEASDIQRVVEAIKLTLMRSQAKNGEFRADVHVKTHGYAEGEFRVLPNLPKELAQGLFQQEDIYRAVVRFSNAASHSHRDVIPDGRGLAIKLLAVKGEMGLVDEQQGNVQDFVMVNHPVFFARNVKDFLRIEQVLARVGNGLVKTFHEALTGGDWNPLRWHWREMLTIAQIAGQVPSHPANTTYFSMSPIRFENFVAKYRTKPVGHRHGSSLAFTKNLAFHPDAMRLALEETLRVQEILFEFQVQLRTTEQSMPVEDATIEWPERESPYQTVAHLLLPRQEIGTLRTRNDYTTLSFNVWHALKSHRPLGGINRVRHWAYPLSSAWRRLQAIVGPK